MGLGELATWLWILAVGGTAFLLLRMVALLLGGLDLGGGDAGHDAAGLADAGHDLGDAGHDLPTAGHDLGDAGHDLPTAGHDLGDAGHGAGEAAHHGAGADLHSAPASDDGHHEGSRWLTLQGAAAFGMGCGWLGLSLLERTHPAVALLSAVAFGAGCAWVVNRGFEWMRGLEDSGTFDPASCVGRVGTVYRRIAPGGRGAVQLEAQGRHVTMDATADVALATGSRVLVYDVTREHVLRVEPWEQEAAPSLPAPRRS